MPNGKQESFVTGLTEAAALRNNVVTVHGIRGDRGWGHGSGFFWAGSDVSSPGPGRLVVTNHHVVKDNTPRSVLPKELRDTELEYQLELDRNRRVPARLLIRDRLLDLAILEVGSDSAEDDFLNLPPGLTSRASDRDARQTRVLDYATPGEPVVRIGSPGVLGEADPEARINGVWHSNNRLRRLVTSGVFGGRDFPGRAKSAHGTETLITDAAGFQGNSGGPVIAVADLAVIGVTSFGRYRDRETELVGIGFEIPAYWIDHLWAEYERIGEERTYLRRMSLGFESENESFVRVLLPPEVADRHDGQETAIQLTEFPKPDSPAFLAGMEHGDTLISFDGIPIEDPSCLIAALTHDGFDKKCVVVIYRGGQELELEITPEEYIPKRFTGA